MLIHRLKFRMAIVVIRFIWGYTLNKQLLRWQSGQEPACQCRRHNRHGFALWARKMPWRRARHAAPVFLPGKSHGQRTLVGYSLWTHKESDMIKHTHTHTHIPSKSEFLDYYTRQTTLKDIFLVFNLKCGERIFALQKHFKKSFLEIVLWPVEAFKAEFDIQKVIYLQLQKTIFLRKNMCPEFIW